MIVLFHCAGDNGALLEALRTGMPDVEFVRTDECVDRTLVDKAVVWQPPTDFFVGLPHLTHVLAAAAGVDQLLDHPSLPASVRIVRLEDAGMSAYMAEYVLYGVLHAQRQMPTLMRAQRQCRWQHHIPLHEAGDFSVGVLGAGAIGRPVALRCRDNGFAVRTWSRGIQRIAGIDHHAGDAGLDAFLKSLDVLVCLLPLTPSTRGLLSDGVFKQLRPGAFLINAARGAHLVEQDLLAALECGQLRGALLDVFIDEPLPPDHPFWQHPDIIVTPHIAAPSPVMGTARQIIDNLRCLQSHGTPRGLVNRDQGY